MEELKTLNPDTTSRASVDSCALPSNQVFARVEHLGVTIEHAWGLITKPELAEMWFGDLSADLSQVSTARLDFGDGDFFSLSDIEVSAQKGVEYSWSFLGLGGGSRIAWQLYGVDGDVSVELTDTSADRTPSGAAELRDGWLDFLERLESHVALGVSTRYDFRHDFEGSIGLAVPLEVALSIIARGGGLFELATPVLAQSSGATIQHHITRSSTSSVSFDLSERGWAKATRCELCLNDKGPHLALGVQQSGWDEISQDRGFCIAQRRFYSERWRAALILAKQKIEQEATSHFRSN